MTSAILAPAANDISVIFVDLDGTLIATDLLHEAIIDGIRRDVWNLVRIPLWAASGPVTLKNALASRVQPNFATLPYRQDVLEFLRAQRAQGVQIVLATASHRDWATAVSDELGVFDDVLATDENINLKGKAKLTAIRSYCSERGLMNWAYVGDDDSDLEIWQEAYAAFAVSRRKAVIRRLTQIKAPRHVFPVSHVTWRSVVKSLRPHHWLKNLLLFVPLLVSHQLTDARLMAFTSLAFLAFSSAASSIYLLNDLLDLSADRQHPKKRNRPFAAGTLPVSIAPALVTILVAVTLCTALSLPPLFQVTLVLYALASMSYAFWLKTKPMLDVILLASLYTIRVIAGGAAADISISEWLLAFSLFMFTALAFAKRYTELYRLMAESRTDVAGRGYLVSDLGLLETLGGASGYLSVLVLVLYIQSQATRSLYRNPQFLWLMCPLILYWISRLWLLARRGHLNEDPVIFALRDRISYMVLGLSLAAIFMATYL